MSMKEKQRETTSKGYKVHNKKRNSAGYTKTIEPKAMQLELQ